MCGASQGADPAPLASRKHGRRRSSTRSYASLRHLSQIPADEAVGARIAITCGFCRHLLGAACEAPEHGGHEHAPVPAWTCTGPASTHGSDRGPAITIFRQDLSRRSLPKIRSYRPPAGRNGACSFQTRSPRQAGARSSGRVGTVLSGQARLPRNFHHGKLDEHPASISPIGNDPTSREKSRTGF